MNDKHTIAVLGIGNPLCSDDGIGIRIIQEMRSSGRYKTIDLIDGGTAPDLFSLLDENVESLIIVDALKGGKKPGSIYRLVVTDENIAQEPPVSLHGLGVLDSLKMMKQLDLHRPQVTILGIEPIDTSHGLKLSPLLEALIPDIINAIEEEIRLCH
ncbi:MAG: hydrogenase maturation protease [Chloroflexi bacterium]|nr:hydrogenase maturation protease [Chloroflexota bacterium]